MKIKLRIKNKNKYLDIPIKIEEIREVYDELWCSILDYDKKYKKLPKNKKKTYKLLASFQNKLMHLVHDIIDEGRNYTYFNGKWIEEKKSYYHKKPKWKRL